MLGEKPSMAESDECVFLVFFLEFMEINPCVMLVDGCFTLC